MSENPLFYIALIPPDPLRSEVTAMKEQLKEEYGLKHALRSLPHITLVPPFRMDTETHQELSRLLSRLAQEQDPFPLRLDGFEVFGNRVIYIRIDQDDRLMEAQEVLASACSRLLGKRPGPDRPYHPHLTLAHRDLTPELFLEIWPLFEEQTFERDFVADTYYLMRHRGTHWEPQENYAFRS